MKQMMMIFEHDKDDIIATDWAPNGIIITAAHYQKFISSIVHPQI